MTDTFTHRLTAGQAVTLAAASAPRRVVVTQGRLWVTVSGDAADHWLSPGGGFTLVPGQEAVLEGWPEAQFQVLAPARVRARRKPRQNGGWGVARGVPA
ncbi:DUF2917 domain-containing protein [Roseateles sp. BYS87W]|uniref:DUF2917 domain-containing protein n=1 Tax=Pelomonas baiyunensis TaxID=3299026 RepID=A0ABW7H040_9BURK